VLTLALAAAASPAAHGAGRSDRFLTGPSGADPAAIALDYLAAHARGFGLDAGDRGGLRLQSRYRSLDGVTHLTWNQRTRGIDGYGTALVANVTAAGQLVSISGSPVPDLELDTAKPAISAEDAVPGRESARLVAFPTPEGAVLAWAGETLEGSDPYELVVDAASGRVLARRPLWAEANAALIYRLHPDRNLTATTVNLGADPSWINRSEGGTKLQGNNAHAKSFLQFTGDETEVAQVGGDWSFPAQFFTHLECPAFGCTWDSDNSFATRHTNRAQTTTQAFWYVNHFHDHLLAAPIGFDEASRNFEFVNSSGQGLGVDPIELVTIRGTSTVLGRFVYTQEGTAPTLETWFSNDPWDVDSSDSAELMYHEYTHGLTFRLVGSGTTLPAINQPRALGEGWSDWYAEDLVVDEGLVADGPASGEVMIAAYLGGAGRTEAIDCAVGASAAVCPGAGAGGTAGPGGYTYGDLGLIFAAAPGEEHRNGEIWGQTLWDLRARVGVRTARCIVTGGLRLTPDNPDFLKARDAILQSALVVGVPQGPLWEVFAARGMGANATTDGYNSLEVTEDFTVPANLPAPPAPTGTCADPPPVEPPGGGPPAGGPGPGPGPGASGPTAAQFAAALAADLRAGVRALGKLRIKKLVKRRRFNAVAVNALTAGRFSVALKAKPKAGKSRAAARSVTVATGSRAASAAGRYSMQVKLTKKGARMLRRVRRLSVSVSMRFAPETGAALARSAKLTLRR